MPPNKSKSGSRSTKAKSRSSETQTQTHSLTPLLPPEVIHKILSHLSIYERTTLDSCALVSKQFNQIATPLLWRWLRLFPHLLLEDGTDLDISTWDQQLLDKVEIFEINTHEEGWCESPKAQRLTLPHLKTLRLNIDTGFTGHREIHYGTEDDENINCRVIQDLRPTTIVYNELEDTFPTFYLDPEFFCPTIWSGVETLIYLLPPVGNGNHYLPEDDKDLSKLLPKLKKLIWIFDPSDIDPEAEGDQCNLYGDERQLLSELLAKNQELKVIVVNVGSTNLRLMKGSRGSFEYIRDWYWESFQDWYWDVLESFRFTMMIKIKPRD